MTEQGKVSAMAAHLANMNQEPEKPPLQKSVSILKILIETNTVINKYVNKNLVCCLYLLAFLKKKKQKTVMQI